MLKCETAGTFSFAAQGLVSSPGGGHLQEHKYLLDQLHPSRRASVKALCAAFTGPVGEEPLMNSTVSPLICAGSCTVEGVRSVILSSTICTERGL